MSNALAAPPPLTRRHVEPGPALRPYRIRSGEQAVGVILAASPDDALTAFVAGRPKPPKGVELRALAVLDLDAEAQR